MILLTSPWLLWNFPSPFFSVSLVSFHRPAYRSPVCVPLPRFRRNSTLLLGRDIDRGFAAEKITAIRDNVARRVHTARIYYIFRLFGILGTPRSTVLPGRRKLIRSPSHYMGTCN